MLSYIRNTALLAILLLVAAVGFGNFSAHEIGAVPGTGTLFGTDANQGNLITVDPGTGAGTVVGNLGSFSAPSLAIDPATGVIYVGQGGGTPNIYTVDKGTGAATLLGDSGLGFAAVAGMEFSSEGTLYAAVNIAGNGGTGSDHLAIIDTTTGAAAVIGPFGTCTGVVVPTSGGGSCTIEGIEGIAFDASGTLWGSHSARGAAGAPGLYTINPGTGAATFVAPIDNGSGAPTGGVVSVQFACDGTLYGGSARALSAATDGGFLGTIDTGTGLWTFVGAVSATGGSSLGGLAFQDTCPLPSIVKAPQLANLWLCNAGPCDNKESGVEGVNLDVNLSRGITSLDPKCVGFPNFLPPEECDTQQIGSFEFEVRFDAKYVTVEVEPGDIFVQGFCDTLAAGAAGCITTPPPDVDCFTATGEGFIQFACVTKGKPVNAAHGPGTLAVVHVRPTADVYKLLIPNQENGIVTQLINQDCQLSDLQGHPIKTDLCENAAITIRYLEGDVHSDCVVNALDQQQIAFRWGAQLGHLLYDARYDLEPSFPKADGDIDAKDLQFIYGRHGSTCKNPHPPQPAVDPQVKVPADTPTPTPPIACSPGPTPTPAPIGPHVLIASMNRCVGEEGTVQLSSLNMEPPGLGAWTIDINYDPTVVEVVNCNPQAGSVCNPAFGVMTIRDTGASASGLEGDTVLALVTFRCIAAGLAPLDLKISVLADATIGDPQPIDAGIQNGTTKCLDE